MVAFIKKEKAMAEKLRRVKYRCIKSVFGKKEIHTFTMKVKDVVFIHYVAIRGRDEEEGAVQRVLSPKRIQSIADFVLQGNMFLNTFVLNWTYKQEPPKHIAKSIIIPIIPESAQVIDGQHRLVGLKKAMETDASIGEKRILVTLCIGLDTKEAANIFLNINTEQKPVPKSLVYDLYGIVFDDKNAAINRATDIAHELHENDDSPYYEKIKFPGQKIGRIDLSTVVSSLKKHLEEDGLFSTYNITSLLYQKTTIFNFFKALQYFYTNTKEDLWDKTNINPFMKNAGFYASIEYLTERLLPKCAEKKSFTVETMKSIMGLEAGVLLKQQDISGLDGKTARKKIKSFLDSNSSKSLPEEGQYEF